MSDPISVNKQWVKKGIEEYIKFPWESKEDLLRMVSVMYDEAKEAALEDFEKKTSDGGDDGE